MKKIISLGIASAVCALTAISASAEAATSFGKFEGKAAKDEVVTLTLVANEDVTDLVFNFQTEGLEVQKIEGNGKVFGDADVKDGKVVGFVASGFDGSFNPAPYATKGEVICTFTLKITAESGVAKLALYDESGKFGSALPEQPYSIDIKGAVTSDPTSSDTTSSDTTSSDTTSSDTTSSDTTSSDTTSTGTDSGAASGTDSGASGTTSGDETKPNPETGVALAVIPAVLAAAGVIVAKKRK